MKPDWDKLSAEFKDSKSGGVYDVDCTAEGKSLCEEVGVQSYPTIKYGDPSDKKALKDYSGGRDMASLKTFAETQLGPTCTPTDLDACSEGDKALLEDLLKRTADDLNAEMAQLEKAHSAMAKKLTKKESKMKDKWADYKDDAKEFAGAKPKKGKEKDHETKKDKLAARSHQLGKEEEALNDELKQHAVKKAGIKLMKMAALHNKGRTDL